VPGRNPARPRHRLGLGVKDSITEVTLVGGERHRVSGDAKQIERLILDAARGSIMQFAWLTDAHTSEPVGVNPEYVVALRSVRSTA
jgi:hypothetical protein